MPSNSENRVSGHAKGNSKLPVQDQSNNTGTSAASNKSTTIEIPSISLPKGGGAIKSIDEKFEVNAVNGSANFSIPLPSRSARGFGPSMNISYNSGGGNGIFGMGWSLSLPSIRRKTEKELPRYLDEIDSDTYILAGAEDLVPKLKNVAGVWVPDQDDSTDGLFSIKRYRPRIENGFARIERWTKKSDGNIQWKIISKDNITSIFGDTAESIIENPSEAGKIFEWLIHFTHDDKGNCALYDYNPENGAGIDPALLHNKNRTNGNAKFTNTYLKRIWSGNINVYNNGDPIPAVNQFLFETAFDYGDHDKINIPFAEVQPWTFRSDAFSDYRAGFEIRNCRLCEKVLQYLHFAELPGGSALVNSLDFKYDDNGQAGNFTFLKEITSTGYIKQANNTYTKKSLPPVSFTYQKHEWNKEIKFIGKEDLVNAPSGIYEPGYQFVDLYSEGLNGILTEQAAGLFYKQNLGNGHFSNAKLITPKPSFTGIGPQLQLQEVEADGTKYLASYHGPNKGFFKLDDEEEWQPFKAFEQLPNVDFNDPYTKLLDLDGDGKADLLITEDNLFIWYPSMGEKGFGESKQVWQSFDEEKGPHVVFNDKDLSIFISDVNGDGLADIVRIRNGSVCYWPNLGYGKFGAKVSMDNAPVFDHPDRFNAAFIKLADIDGSGTTDIIYLGRNYFKVWLNQSGNGFLTSPEEIDPFPEITNLSQVSVLDLFGNGTSCIVWSSVQPKDHNRPLQYIDLVNSKKPHIMVGYKNNLGKEVEFEYTTSTSYYLQDSIEGKPWITKLPFPIHCLSKVITWDRIMKTRFASEYSYHHGYYDHAEREFRGFGRVDQKDAEDITHFIKVSVGAMNNVSQDNLLQHPVLIKTWFHTGAFLDREKILNQFAHEYSQNSVHPENVLPEPELPGDLSVDEWRQALRACKSMMLRQEVYALDNSAVSDKPYTVDQHNCLIKIIQPKLENKHGSFIVLNSESISYHYERDLADPRVSHSFMLEADEFANIKRSAALVYSRKPSGGPQHRAEQRRQYTTLTENDFTDPVNTATDYRTPLLYQAKDFEVTGLPAPAGNYYSLSEIKNACNAAAFIHYHVIPDGTLQKRLVDWNRVQFRGDDSITVLAFGTMDSKGLMHQKFSAAFNQSQLTNIFNPKITFANLNAVLLDPAKGGYIFADNYFWIPSGVTQYDVANFFLPVSFTDAFGNTTQIEYDIPRHLFIQKTTDALGNEMKVKKFNYRVMQPYLVEDANDNLSAIRFDEFGIPIKTFIIGKKGIDAGDEFDDTSVETTASDFPSSEMEYRVSEWYNQSTNLAFDINNYKPQPNYIFIKVRETHYNADNLHQSKFHESYTYLGGSGNEVLKKHQAEPGSAIQVNPDGTTTLVADTSPNLRWVGNGRVVLSNKGLKIKEYEPYFSTSPSFDDEKEMVELGVTNVMQYDPLGRMVRTDFPDKTFSKIEFSPWLQKTFDRNDTVDQSDWYDLRITNPDPVIATPAEISAAQKAFLHKNTPEVAHLDSLGRVFFTEADNVTEKLTTHITLDIEGKEISINDALDRTVMEYEYDLLGRTLKQVGMDAGTRWFIMNASNTPLLQWDDINHENDFEYDQLRRPVAFSVKTGNAPPEIFAKIQYGESLVLAAAKANNLRGIAYKKFDQSGVLTTIKNDFKGNMLSGSKQLVADYKNIIDWTNIAAVALEAEIFTNDIEYDVLNRPLKIITPHSAGIPPSEIYHGFNEAGLLEKVEVRIRGAAALTTFVTNINYDAKGRREEIFYNNGTKSKYIYDKETFRLVRLKTTRNPGPQVLLDLQYTYDPVGNVTRIKDNNHPDIFFDGEQVAAQNDYDYDAVYRLIKSTGRKHAGQTDIQSKATLPNNNSFRNHPFINSAVIDPNDANAFRNYTERYLYNKAGNMKQQTHVAKNSSWTRTFEYDNNNDLNNMLTKSSIGGDDYNYTYDPHGNMHGMESVQNELWDFMDRFKEAGLGGGGTVYYVYDSTGERIRKVIERQNGLIQERIYLAGIEIYRERNNAGTTLERETLHVMDDRTRIAMVDTPVIVPAGNNENQLIRYQYDNHLSSSTLELDDAAQTISYEEYFPYGTTSFSTIDATREIAAKRYRYTGKERDEETGFSYHGARYYLPWLLRWMSCDPGGLVDGLNLYSYARNSPVVYKDLTGNDSESEILKKGAETSGKFKSTVEAAHKDYAAGSGLDVKDFLAIITVESMGNPNDVSQKTGKYRGLLQLSKADDFDSPELKKLREKKFLVTKADKGFTWTDKGILDPTKNIRFGVFVISQRMQLAKESINRLDVLREKRKGFEADKKKWEEDKKNLNQQFTEKEAALGATKDPKERAKLKKELAEIQKPRGELKARGILIQSNLDDNAAKIKVEEAMKPANDLLQKFMTDNPAAAAYFMHQQGINGFRSMLANPGGAVDSSLTDNMPKAQQALIKTNQQFIDYWVARFKTAKGFIK
ncbi:MAG: spvB [Chitinophagaceae bacterium]|nr:spvB [Chitinophagaceae bacterium]